jgi:hypothetical protein
MTVRQISTNVGEELAAFIFKSGTMLSSVLVAAGSSETAVPLCQITLHHISQDSNLHTTEISYPPIERGANCWPPVKSYFLALGVDSWIQQIWKYMEMCESGQGAREETCVKLVYCAFLKNALRPMQRTIKELEL